MKKGRPLWAMLGLAALLIICGFITVFNPLKFWGVVNILLGIVLLFSGISAIINSINNQKTQYISFLFVVGILAVMLGSMLILSWKGDDGINLVGKLMVWMFALWAFMRGGMLIFFGIQNKENVPLWRGICTLGGILVVLAILTAVSSAKMAKLVGICIGISIIFDGLSLLFFAIRGGGSKDIQNQIINESNQNEIGQGDVVITETVITEEKVK